MPPITDVLLHSSETTLCATTGLNHHNKAHCCAHNPAVTQFQSSLVEKEVKPHTAK